MPRHADRRDFLRRSLAASSLVAMGAGTVPGFLGRSARAAGPGVEGGRVLVVVQLVGGNDGLNTVVPHGLDGYGRSRKALRLPAEGLHRLGDGVGLHAEMGGIARLIGEGKGAIIQGVGYPNPDRSHFRSMEIWESARSGAKDLETGWLGRAIDAGWDGPGGDPAGLQVDGRALPLALKARKVEVPSLTTLEQYRLLAGGGPLVDASPARPDDADPLLGFVRRSSLTAYATSRRFEDLAGQGDGGTPAYPETGLAGRLATIARIIKAGFGTRIYYTTLDGFDTHSRQLATHAHLLRELSGALAAFRADLDGAGQGDRVAVLAFSEFGRRLAENGSLGTDHGAAAPVFLLGPVARAGLVGDHPGLDPADLDPEGDPTHRVDFRRVYASILDEWLGLPSGPIVGPDFAPLGLFRPAAG